MTDLLAKPTVDWSTIKMAPGFYEARLTPRPSDVLKEARARVERGWIQNAGHGPGGVCAAYAISATVNRMTDHAEVALACPCAACMGVSPVSGRATCLLLDAAHERTGIRWDSIPEWNDYPGRTRAEVLETFDHAIKTAERDAL